MNPYIFYHIYAKMALKEILNKFLALLLEIAVFLAATTYITVLSIPLAAHTLCLMLKPGRISEEESELIRAESELFRKGMIVTGRNSDETSIN